MLVFGCSRNYSSIIARIGRRYVWFPYFTDTAKKLRARKGGVQKRTLEKLTKDAAEYFDQKDKKVKDPKVKKPPKKRQTRAKSVKIGKCLI